MTDVYRRGLTIKEFSVVDLFCGVGGLTHGFKLEDFKVVAGFDIDESCKFAYEQNNDAVFYLRDVAEVSSSEIKSLFGSSKVKILVGCAPCQPFSSYTFKDKKRDNDKWGLLYHFARLIRETKPEIVSMENVAQLVNFKQAPVFNDFTNSLKELGYFVHYEIVNCQEYGIPQKRKRLVLLASKFGEIELIPKTHSKKDYITVKDVIENLPVIKDGEFSPHDLMHYSRKLTTLNKKRIKSTPYGGSWKDWPKELQLECHKRDSGKSYVSIYGRMKWEEPSPTLTTHCIGYGNGRFGHPVQDRGISLREAALLQTFPIDYRFFDENLPFSSVKIARQLGNAVPVQLGKVIARSIKKHLKIK